MMIELPVRAAVPRDDVLVIVNDNSIDSVQLGAYYAQQRNIDPANIVHLRVPDSFFISWDDFRRLRDQLIYFMQANTLDDPSLTPVACTDGEPPFYCQAAMDQLSPQHRATLELTYYHGMSCREVAEVMSCNENTVKTRMFHARRKMRAILPPLASRSASERSLT